MEYVGQHRKNLWKVYTDMFSFDIISLGFSQWKDFISITFWYKC